MNGVRWSAVAAFALLLAACSSESRSSTETAAPTTPPTTAAVTTAPVTATPASTAVATTAATPTSSVAPGSTTAAPTTPAPSVPTTTAAPAPAATIADLLALGRPIVLAHTGGEDEFPGSTLFGYGESAKAGVDMLDLNVMLTSDGVLVVQHDDSVDRLTNATGKVADMTYAELQALDNAYWFTPDGVGKDHPADAYVYRGIRTGERPPPAGSAAGDFAIPRFSDLVARFPDIPLNIEIEGSGAAGAGAATELAKELHDLGRDDASVVTSFDDATVDVFRGLAPSVEVGPGLGASAAWVLSGTPLPAGMRILQLPPDFNGIKVITAASIDASHAAGYLIWVWPNDRALENESSYRQFLDEGVDGLNINFPAQGVDALHGFLPTGT